MSGNSKADLKFHRKFGAACFNRAWDYLVMKKRSSEDDREMLCLAHASRYHWGIVGTPSNWAIADWQISRVYADLGEPGLALQFAKASLSTCKKNALTELEPTANEAIARAYAVAKDIRNARKFIAKARRQLDRPNFDKEERETYLGQIRDTERLISAE
jgi:hypothetical protein